jgi:curved DNA-binding protein CbpA
MDSNTLPDHYKALGVDKTADASTIKAIYRKLVLKCHPDKVTDPALKEQKQEEFHQIQQAYEVLIDDEKRAQYESELTVEKLRRENRATRAARDKNARFDGRTPSGAQFAATGSSRYHTEARVPTKPRDDDRYFDDRARKHETYEPSPPKYTTAPRTSREKESSSKTTRQTPDRTRSDREKTRAKEGRSDRKFVSVESDSSSDDKARYEAEYKRRDDEAARRKAEERRTYEDNRYAGAPPAHRKMSVQAEEALRYQHKSRIQVEDEMARPSPVRTSSRDYYKPEARSSRRDPRPEPVRRSSARPTMSRRDSERTDRGIPEVVEWAEDRRGSEDVGRRPPTFKHVSSSPAELARGVPQRSYTEHSRAENSPPPSFHRSATMPVSANTSSRRKDSTVPRPSGLREAMTPPEHHSSPERDAYPSVPPPATPSGNTTRYYYGGSGGGVQVRPENVPASTPRTVLREPARHQRSPSPMGPISKPPIGVHRPPMAESTASYRTVRPPMPSRTESSRNISPTEDRGRSKKLYGEVGTDSRRGGGRQPSYDQNDVSYTRKYGHEDVRWAPRSGEERGYASKPSLGRTATYVY